MSAPYPLILDLAVGVRPQVRPDGSPVLTAEQAGLVVAGAAAAGVAAIRVREEGALDASVAAAFLAHGRPDIGFLVDAATSHNAPYNLARRIGSIDRATRGGAGVVLHPGAGDVNSDQRGAPQRPDRAARWSEYAAVLGGLFTSFPAEALVGDHDGARLADPSRLRPPNHVGAYYAVAGPLDGPASIQRRPVLATADGGALGWDAAVSADVLLLDSGGAETDSAAAAAALARAGRPRADVAVFACVVVTPAAEDVGTAWPTPPAGVDGLELRIAGGAEDILRTLAGIAAAAPRPGSPGATLRARLGLPALVPAAAGIG